MVHKCNKVLHLENSQKTPMLLLCILHISIYTHRFHIFTQVDYNFEDFGKVWILDICLWNDFFRISPAFTGRNPQPYTSPVLDMKQKPLPAIHPLPPNFELGFLPCSRLSILTGDVNPFFLFHLGYYPHIMRNTCHLDRDWCWLIPSVDSH